MIFLLVAFTGLIGGTMYLTKSLESHHKAGNITFDGYSMTKRVTVEGDNIDNEAIPTNDAAALNVNNDEDTMTNGVANVALPISVQT